MKINDKSMACEPLSETELKAINGGVERHTWAQYMWKRLGKAVAEYDNRFAINLSALAGGNQDSSAQNQW